MGFDYGIEEGSPRAKTKYNFDMLRAGASLHVATKEERVRVLAAFRYWVQQREEKKVITPGVAYATSAKVGEEDPKGPGYRVWFKSKAADARLTAARVDHPRDEI